MSRRQEVQVWPWLPFIILSLTMALLPGFILGAVLVLALSAGWQVEGWYGAAVQAHGHAQLLGWGGAMILGVLLYFLPKLRGAPLAHAHRIPTWFWLLAAGMTLRVGGQALGPLFQGSLTWVPWLMVVATAMELAAVLGLLVTLVRTAAHGAPRKPAGTFIELRHFLAAAALALAAGVGFLLLGAAAATAAPSFTLAGAANRAATDLLLFGFIGAISVGMTARLFPMFARTAVARPYWLQVSAGFFLAGVLARIMAAAYRMAGTHAAAFDAVWPLLIGLGFLLGAFAVRAFEPRRTVPEERETEYVRKTRPVSVGGSLAYGWAVLAGILLVVNGLHQLGLAVPLGRVPMDAVTHAVGAGFMTVLIFTVAPIMLPGFAGARPLLHGGQLWLLLVLGNGAALLRTLPHFYPWLVGGALPVSSTGIMAAAGLLGTLGVMLLAWMLWQSWRHAQRAA